jgi:hypothetical protein
MAIVIGRQPGGLEAVRIPAQHGGPIGHSQPLPLAVVVGVTALIVAVLIIVLLIVVRLVLLDAGSLRS